MRKIISALALSLLGLMVGLLVFAAVPPTPIPEITQCTMRHDLSAFGLTCTNPCVYKVTPDCGACCILDVIYTVTDWVFYIVLAFAIIFIIWGAFQIMSAAGAPEKVNTGRNYIIYAVVGLIIGLLARSIPYIARTILGA